MPDTITHPAGDGNGAGRPPRADGKIGSVIRVVYNPVAGHLVVRKIDRIRAALDRRGASYEVLETSGPGHATELAQEAALRDFDAVVAVGGDGTVNEVANGLAGRATRMAVVAHGTGNVYAREVGLPDDPGACIDLLFAGKTVAFPLARAGERYFVLMGSAGFDAEVLERMTPRSKNVLGISAYVLTGLRHLLRRPPTLWLEFPGRERIEVQAVIVCRGRMYGGGITMAPDASLLDRTLHLVGITKPGRISLVLFTLAALRGRHAGLARVATRTCETVNVRCRMPSAAQVDGEYLGPLPVRFSMTDVLLRAVVPPSFPPA